MSTNCDQTPEPTLVDVIRAIDRLRVAMTSERRELLSREDVAALLNIGETTLDTLRAKGDIGPPAIHLGKCVRWRRVEILAWLAARKPDGSLPTLDEWAAIVATQAKIR